MHACCYGLFISLVAGSKTAIRVNVSRVLAHRTTYARTYARARARAYTGTDHPRQQVCAGHGQVRGGRNVSQGRPSPQQDVAGGAIEQVSERESVCKDAHACRCLCTFVSAYVRADTMSMYSIGACVLLDLVSVLKSGARADISRRVHAEESCPRFEGMAPFGGSSDTPT